MHFNEWMSSATDEEKAKLATEVSTSKAYLYLMERKHKPVSPRMAAKLEAATKKITPDRLIDARASVTIDDVA